MLATWAAWEAWAAAAWAAAGVVAVGGGLGRRRGLGRGLLGDLWARVPGPGPVWPRTGRRRRWRSGGPGRRRPAGPSRPAARPGAWSGWRSAAAGRPGPGPRRRPRCRCRAAGRGRGSGWPPVGAAKSDDDRRRTRCRRCRPGRRRCGRLARSEVSWALAASIEAVVDVERRSGWWSRLTIGLVVLLVGLVEGGLLLGDLGLEGGHLGLGALIWDWAGWCRRGRRRWCSRWRSRWSRWSPWPRRPAADGAGPSRQVPAATGRVRLRAGAHTTAWSRARGHRADACTRRPGRRTPPATVACPSPIGPARLPTLLVTVVAPPLVKRRGDRWSQGCSSTRSSQ